MENKVILELLTNSSCQAGCGHCRYGKDIPPKGEGKSLENMAKAYTGLHGLGFTRNMGPAGGEVLGDLGFIVPKSVATFYPTLPSVKTLGDIAKGDASNVFLGVLKSERRVLIQPSEDSQLTIGIKVVDDFGHGVTNIRNGVVACVDSLLSNLDEQPEFTTFMLRFGVNDLSAETKESFLSNRFKVLSALYTDLMSIKGLSVDLSASTDNPSISSGVVSAYFRDKVIKIGMRYIRPLHKGQNLGVIEEEILDPALLPIMLTPTEVRFFHSTYNINDPAYSVSYDQFMHILESSKGSKETFFELCMTTIRKRIDARDAFKSIKGISIKPV